MASFSRQLTMMKNLLLIATMMLPAAWAAAQSPDDQPSADTLIKYSYNIAGRYASFPATTITTYTATGFFVRSNGEDFFVTAGHVLSGCKDRLQVKKNYPDSMQILLNNGMGHFTGELIPVNLTSFRDTGVCPAIKYPDLGIVRLSGVVEDSLFSIENMMQDTLSAITGTIKIIGFPVDRNAARGAYSSKEASVITIRNYQLLDSVNFINDQVELEVDSTNFIVVPKGVPVDATLGGYSGSPAFEFNDNRWRFIGVLMGANTIRKYLVIVKPRYLQRKLESL